jgi:serine/threonine-protein kinase
MQALADLDPIVGSVLAHRYRVFGVAGEGAMGLVYRAHDLATARHVALKVLHGEMAAQPDLAERFITEARATARIESPHVVKVLDFGYTAGERPFYAMELLEGQDLHEALQSQARPFPWRRARPIFEQITAGMQAAHDAGIVHRDLKPENIFLVDRAGISDFVVVFDFGIAKVRRPGERARYRTRIGFAFGTPEYMSPEQARGEAVDHRTDIYAAGCVLFEMLTGRPPFRGRSLAQVLDLHAHSPMPALSLSPEDAALRPALEAVLARALAKARDDRYASIAEFAAAVAARTS